MLKIVTLLFCLPVIAYAQTEMPQEYQCGGTEPFWSLSLAHDSATLQRLGRDDTNFDTNTMLVASGRLWPVLFSLTHDNDIAQAIIRPLACSDGMSDITYEFTVDILIREHGEPVLLTGCCRPPDPSN